MSEDVIYSNNETTGYSGLFTMPDEKPRYKMYVHIPELKVNDPQVGGIVVIQQEDQQIYKRVAMTENEAKALLEDQLKDYYKQYEIVKIEKDKTHTL